MHLQAGRPVNGEKEADVVVLTQRAGRLTAVSAALVERVAALPETVVTLVHGAEYFVPESVAQVVDSVEAYRASVLDVTARLLAAGDQRPTLRLLREGHEG